VVTLVPVRPGTMAIPATGTLGLATVTTGNLYQSGLSVPFHPRDDVKRASKPLLNACFPLVQLKRIAVVVQGTGLAASCSTTHIGNNVVSKQHLCRIDGTPPCVGSAARAASPTESGLQMDDQL